jgi:NAD(P)H-dependent FMN reductase
MAGKANLLAFAGSTRSGSWNRKLIQVAADSARGNGAEVTLIELSDYPLPLYNGDLEESQGLPEAARELAALFDRHDGFLISAPEYNSSITPLLKNTIDWISRPADGVSGLKYYASKTAAFFAASPGALGGLRGLFHCRQIMSTLGVMVIPDQLALVHASKAFDDAGELQDEKTRERVDKITGTLVRITERIAS